MTGEHQHILYKTTNIINGKIYIGVHNNTNPGYLGSGSYIKNAVLKYGKENFVRETLFEGTREEVLIQEAKLVNEEFVDHAENYNMAIGGGNPPCASTFSDVTLKKMSDAATGRIFSDAHKQRLSDIGKKRIHSDASKQKISESNKGRIFSEEHIKKLEALRFTQPVVSCPHCNATGGKSLMTRYHFDRCLYKQI